ncbi:hypothetical protein [Streptomyces sp. YS-3]|uniref:hypothetical protein n=1 Tax=Streptomyces sp. YS-3 TaxID=3381352 RepID=UPI0038627183
MDRLHPLDDARRPESVGTPTRLVRLVAHNSGSAATEDQLKDFPVLEALLYADMTAGPAGRSFDFNRRNDEILVRYEVGE